MKTINYTGSSKLISRIVNLLNRRAPLPLNGSGDPVWGTNGQFLTTDGAGGTTWSSGGGGGDTVSWTQDVTTGTKIASIDINGNSTDVYAPSGGSGGHTIEDTSGADLHQRENLQFVGVYTEDDSDHDRTKVNIVRQMTKAAMQALSSAEQEGFIDTTDEDDDYIPISAEDVKRGVSDVDADLTALENGKVNRSGDTMSGSLTINSSADVQCRLAGKNSGTSTASVSVVLGNNIPNGTTGSTFGGVTLYGTSSYYTSLKARNSTANRYIELPNADGTLCIRTVTTLVNESTTIASGSTKTYSALTLSALQAYDELTFMFASGNVLFNGSMTKAQLNMIAGISSGKMYIFGGQIVASGSVSLDYKCKVYANASGLSILNQSSSSSIDKVLIEGITY